MGDSTSCERHSSAAPGVYVAEASNALDWAVTRVRTTIDPLIPKTTPASGKRVAALMSTVVCILGAEPSIGSDGTLVSGAHG